MCATKFKEDSHNSIGLNWVKILMNKKKIICIKKCFANTYQQCYI